MYICITGDIPHIPLTDVQYACYPLTNCDAPPSM